MAAPEDVEYILDSLCDEYRYEPRNGQALYDRWFAEFQNEHPETLKRAMQDMIRDTTRKPFFPRISEFLPYVRVADPVYEMDTEPGQYEQRLSEYWYLLNNFFRMDYDEWWQRFSALCTPEYLAEWEENRRQLEPAPELQPTI